MMLAAMLAMVMLLAAPAMAQTADDSIVERCVATLDQSNEGDVIAANESNQDAAQYQYAPGGDADANIDQNQDQDQDQYDNEEEDEEETGSSLQADTEEEEDVDFGDQYQYQDANIDATGGAGGTQDIDQYADQYATATGATFEAEQAQYCSQVALSAE